MDKKINVQLLVGPEGGKLAAAQNTICIVVDVLRASSTVISAFAAGVRAVRAVANVTDCQDELTAGERHCVKIPELDLGNSPLAMLNPAHKGKRLSLVTTNGTQCVAACQQAPVVLIGALLNCQAVASYAENLAREKKLAISIILAGYHGELEDDDWIAASAIAKAINNYQVIGDLPLYHCDDFSQGLLTSPAGKRLQKISAEDDILYCAEKDKYHYVPHINQEQGVFLVG